MTKRPPDFRALSCSECIGGADLDFDFTMAFQPIVGGILQACDDMKIRVIAEGVETREEYHALKDMGVVLFQGYYFARPAWEALAEVNLTALG